jgi:hypothetical protein
VEKSSLKNSGISGKKKKLFTFSAPNDLPNKLLAYFIRAMNNPTFFVVVILVCTEKRKRHITWLLSATQINIYNWYRYASNAVDCIPIRAPHVARTVLF